MSHVVQVSVEFHDLDALEAACKELGLQLNRGKATYRWFGRHVKDYPLPEGFTEQDLGKCEHSISVKDKPNAYEVGLCQRRDGKAGYTLLYDFWQGGMGLMEKVGESCTKLRQAYSVAVAEKTARQRGYKPFRRQLPNGAIQVVARK